MQYYNTEGCLSWSHSEDADDTVGAKTAQLEREGDCRKATVPNQLAAPTCYCEVQRQQGVKVIMPVSNQIESISH